MTPKGVTMDEFLERVDREQERRGIKTPPPAHPLLPPAVLSRVERVEQRARQIEDNPRSRFMSLKVIGIAIWGVICLAAFLAVPGVGAAGASLGLFYAVVSATFERRPSPPVLFDIANTLRRR